MRQDEGWYTGQDTYMESRRLVDEDKMLHEDGAIINALKRTTPVLHEHGNMHPQHLRSWRQDRRTVSRRHDKRRNSSGGRGEQGMKELSEIEANACSSAGTVIKLIAG